MTNETTFYYIPRDHGNVDVPLGRYYPPIFRGVASTWLENHIARDRWLLDPFGASPDLAIEAAQKGYRILVAANNPVTRFILEFSSHPVSELEFQAAIAELATSNVGHERLEPLILSQYKTRCEACGKAVIAKAFLWKSDPLTPVAKIYECKNCGDSGERPVNSNDIELAQKFAESSLHRSRALERVAPLNDPDRAHVEEALAVYLPRAIYVLITIINKLSGLEPRHLRLLSALLLSTFDRANTLWPHPVERKRPRQLIVPTQFCENNIWFALEEAKDLWTSIGAQTPISYWPELPPESGGICIYEGRVRELANDLAQIDIGAVLTVFPRPNQAFWTLSALWSGWLWGHEAVDHFKSVLRRRRYDWGWHTTAIAAALNSLIPSLPHGLQFFGTINENEPGFLSAVILGGQLAHLEIENLAVRKGDQQAQILWRTTKTSPKVADNDDDIEAIICEASRETLKERGEPSPYMYLHTNGLLALVRALSPNADSSPSDYLSRVQGAFQTALSFRNGFLRFEGSANSLEVGKWWYSQADKTNSPLSDRVEIEIVKFLLRNPGSKYSQIDAAICKHLSGLTPPERELIQEILDSYGVENPPESGCWFIREQDSPKKRLVDISEMAYLLSRIGTSLGFGVIYEDSILQWQLEHHPQIVFYLSASAVLGKYLLAGQYPPEKSLIVLPGSRANLVAYKLLSNPHLDQIIAQGWRFLKYRHVRQLAENPNLTLSNLDKQFSLDPLTYGQPQMRLL